MNLPEDFCRQMEGLLGNDAYGLFVAALEKEQPVSIRLNRKKLLLHGRADAAGKGMSSTVSGVGLERVGWCSDGYYLNVRPAFTFDPLFHAGCYYVQEASSMFLEQLVRRYVEGPVTALDLCAAPGGKATHLRSLLPEGSVLVANEVIRQRAQILAENMQKWGEPDVLVTNNDPADFASFAGRFDLVVADAPCSGEGMFRKDEGAVREWSADNVRLCSERQRRILADIWGVLRPGGILVYSTCTYNRCEDEDNLAWLQQAFGAEPLSVDCPPEWGITGDLTGRGLPVYRFLPHRVQGEGFFLCAVRKPEDADDVPASPAFKGKRSPKPSVSPVPLGGWLHEPERYSIRNEGADWLAIPKQWEQLYVQASSCLRVCHAGIPLGSQKGKDLIPSHALAMSIALEKNAFPRQEVDYDTAISYLRKEAVCLSADTPRGYVLLVYKGIPLGFVKNIGNRANNLYPNEWRIRSPYLPEGIREAL